MTRYKFSRRNFFLSIDKGILAAKEICLDLRVDLFRAAGFAPGGFFFILEGIMSSGNFRCHNSAPAFWRGLILLNI